MLQRLLALVLGLMLATGVGVWGYYELQPERGHLGFKEISDEAIQEATEEASARLEVDAFRVPLDEQTVSEIMSLNGRVYDPHCYFRYRENQDTKRKWKAHPDGYWMLRTNSLGLRMDEELLERKPDLRVLVAGDSHMAGLCNNSESFSGQLAQRLAAADDARSVEVINGSCGAYSFFHYLGVLERMLHLGYEPDLFVVVVFGGNDFNANVLWHVFHGTERAPQTKEGVARRALCAKKAAKALGQALSQVEYFVRGGEAEIELAGTVADTVLGEMRRQCDERGIGFLVVYLPAPTELPSEAQETAVVRGLEMLELGAETLELIPRMADRMLLDLWKAQTPHLDLRPPFLKQDERLYWSVDLHLNLTGHAVMADVVAPWVEDWWASRGQ